MGTPAVAAADVLDVRRAERDLRAGALAILPTDTVYGLACAAYRRDACELLYDLKGRGAGQPTALVLGTVDNLLQNVLPELMGRTGVLVRRALPGPLTLVVPNPGRRFAYICGGEPGRIGVRVPELPDRIAQLADAVGGLAMTSANLPGEPAPASLVDVPAPLRYGVTLVVDGGTLPGAPSTVVDVTGREPVVLRAGALELDEISELLAAR
jgi:L-threonylcarbamoyladenylate synthase